MQRGYGALLLALLVPGSSGAIAEPAPAPPPDMPAASLEVQVKAGFLYQFAANAEWPPRTFSGPAMPLTICTMGNDAVHQALEEILQNRKVGGRSLAARKIKEIPEIRACHILFAGKSQEERLPEILETARAIPVMTVGETERFARLGGLITFTLVNNRIAFEINADAASRSGVVLSPKLLGLGKVVHAGGGTPN